MGTLKELNIESIDFYRQNRELLDAECEAIKLEDDERYPTKRHREVIILTMQIDLLKDDIEKLEYEVSERADQMETVKCKLEDVIDELDS